MAGVAAQHADFSNGSINETKLHGANLSGASFFKSKGSSCAFVNTSLDDANFNGAYLINVNFENARLNRAKFVGAHISGQIDGADLSESDFSFASLDDLFPTKAKSCAGLHINGKTKLPHWNRSIYEELLSEETAEVVALWVEHGAILVPPLDDQENSDDDTIRAARIRIEAIEKIMEKANGIPPL
jgi:Pentapeptide repeats (9 copies)